jgi:hypothetical protein
MGYPAPCTVLLPVNVRLEHIVLGPGLFFFIWPPSFSWGSLCPSGASCCDRQAGAQSPWIGVALSNHHAWDSAWFTPSFSEGERPVGQGAFLLWRRFESSGGWVGKKGILHLSKGTSCRGGDYVSYACWEGSVPMPGLKMVGLENLLAKGMWVYMVMSYQAEPYTVRTPRNIAVMANARPRGAPWVTYDMARWQDPVCS